MSSAQEHTEHKKKHGGGHHGPPHGGGHEEAHEGAPEWLISFADNVTLMMGFFVILLAMNLKPTTGGGESKTPGQPAASAEVLDTVIAIREAFNNPVDPNSANPIDLPLIRRMIERSGESQAERKGQIGNEHDVRSIRRSDRFGLAGRVGFPRDSATVDAAGQGEIDQILKAVRGYRLVIELRGHVSADEARRAGDHGMKLAFDRALGVGSALAAAGVPWRQIRVIACADGERLAPQAYAEADHETNRRVEIIVTDRVWDETAPDGEAP